MPRRISRQRRRKPENYISGKIPTSLTEFSNKVILNIMNHLGSIYDKMSLSMTCTRMYNLFNSQPQLHKDKFVKVSCENDLKFFEIFNAERKKLRYPILPHVKFDDGVKTILHEKFWYHYGENILSLDFNSCRSLAGFDILPNVFEYCPNLEELRIYRNDKNDLNRCSQLKFNKLKKLEIKKSLLSDYALNNFIENAPNLKHLDTEFPRENGEENIKYKESMKYAEIFRKKDKKLHYTNLSYQNLLRILPMSKITTWKIDYINFAEIQDICNLKQSGFKLEDFSIKYTEKNDGHALNVILDLIICTYSDTLLHFDISDCHNHLKNQLIGFYRLKNLKTLKLPDYVPDKNLMEIKELKNLENLHLGTKKFTYISDELQLNEVLTELPNLCTLVIKGADLKDFDLFLNNTSAKLLELELYECNITTSLQKCFYALTKKHKMLYKLTIRNCNMSVKDKDICSGEIKLGPGVKEHYDGISALKNLKYLFLNMCLITDEGVINAFRWNELTELRLYGCLEIGDKALVNLHKNCPALVLLELCGCSSITDKGVQHLPKLTRLRKIDLSCTKITKNSLWTLLNTSCPLTELDHGINIYNDEVLECCIDEKINHLYEFRIIDNFDDLGFTSDSDDYDYE